MTTAKKVFSARNMLVATAILLIAALVTTIAVINTRQSTPAAGIANDDNYDDGLPVVYSLRTESLFKKATGAYIHRFYDDILKNALLNAGELIGGRLLNVFRAARISEDKVENLTAYLNGLDNSSDSLVNFFLFFCDVTVEDGEQVAVFNPTRVNEIFTGESGVSEAFEEFIGSTMFTSAELGRIVYEIFASGGSEAGLAGLGQDGFQTLFVRTIEAAELFSEFLDGSSGSISTARQTREIIYDLGNSLKALIEEYGADGIAAMLGFGGGNAFSDMFEYLREYYLDFEMDVGDLGELDELQEILWDMRGVLAFGLEAAAEFLVKVDESAFSNFVRGATGEGEDYGRLSMTGFLSVLNDALDYAYSVSDIEGPAELASRIAAYEARAAAIADPAIDMEAYLYARADDIGEFLGKLGDFKQKFGAVKTLADIAALGAEAENYQLYIDYFGDYDYSGFADNLDRLGGVLFINTALEWYLAFASSVLT